MLRPVFFCALVLVFAACRPDPLPPPVTIEVTSDTLVDGGRTPTAHTCEGSDTSPPLRWRRVKDAAGYAVTMIDRDAPGGEFVHWIVMNIPSSTTRLDPGRIPGEAVEGQNDFGELGYAGPCPPPGNGAHRYVVTVFAIREGTGLLEEGVIFEEFEDRIACCIGGSGTLTTSFER